MLIYGDRRRIAEPAALLADIETRLVGLPRSGLARHAALVGAFLVGAQLEQGLADAAFQENGADDATANGTALPLLLALADAVDKSWRSGFRDAVAAPFDVLDRVRAGRLPERVETVIPEGHAFYAVYPEAFAEAARRAPLPIERVIAIRSIGTSLGAMVAAAHGCRELVTVRPVGHPFDRRLRLTREAEDGVSPVPTAVVDEGPGLSGSSFGAVLDLLDRRGVPEASITVFPSHTGELGRMAGEARRARWARMRRFVVDVDALVLRSTRPEHRLASWAEPLIGPLTEPIIDLSGGAWRERLGTWPASNTAQERRKFLLRSERGAFLAKFIGLGVAGERAASRAAALSEAGFTPPLCGVVHGFSIERFLDDAEVVTPGRIAPEALAARAGDYLRFRARHLSAAPEDGATRAELFDAARANIEEALGAETARRLDRFVGLRAEPIRRHATDNKLDLHEWLIATDGRLLKTDAVDHCAAHDLVGCQDLAWDIAGASVELGLGAGGMRALLERASAASGQSVTGEMLDFARCCYLAIRLGGAVEAAHALGDDDKRRMEALAGRYAEAFERSLGEGG